MAQTAKLGIDVGVKSDELDKLLEKFAKLNGMLTGPVSEGFKHASTVAEESAHKQAASIQQAASKITQSHLSAEAAMTKASQENATKRAHLASLEFHDLEHELDQAKIKKQNAETAMTLATDTESKKRIAITKKEAQEELKLLNDEYKKRPQVAHGGEGAEHGVLGVGREVLGMGGGGAGMMQIAGAAGVAGAAMMLIEKGKEASERMEELKIGLMTGGKSAEEAEKEMDGLAKSSHEVAQGMALSTKDVEAATAQYLKMGGTTDNLKQKQEDIAALSKKAGVDMEMAAKMFAKAGDPEIAANMKKFGIELTGLESPAERAQKIHEKLAGTVAGMKDAANGPLGSFKKLQDMIETLIDTFSGLIFGALGPVFSILSEIGTVVSDILTPVFQIIGAILQGVGDGIMSVVTEIKGMFVGMLKDIFPAKDGIGNIGKVIAEYVTPAVKFLVANSLRP